MSLTGTKQAIFDASAELFAREGYHNVSVRQISKAVGIKPSSIYNHYASKEDILTDILSFYEQNLKKYEPDLEHLLEMVGREHPHKILMRTIIVYPAGILPIMSRAMCIANALSRTDAQAERIVRSMLVLAEVYDKPVLERLLALDLIEPLNIDNFILIHSNYCYCAAVLFYTDCAIATPDYIAGLELLFQLVKPKNGGILAGGQ